LEEHLTEGEEDAMKAMVLMMALGLAGMAGCSSQNRSPDAIRNDTAKATATAAKDVKAVAQGVADGLRQKGTVNINKASSDELQTLPGVTPQIADTIIADRPYESGAELLRRRIVSKNEYDQIADRIVTR
jgi:DNA uptake protein ComE-like DNA-binding protein